MPKKQMFKRRIKRKRSNYLADGSQLRKESMVSAARLSEPYVGLPVVPVDVFMREMARKWSRS